MSQNQNVAHHFDNYEQQVRAEKLGMWLFLATEILMFGGLFVAYLIYSREYPIIFKAGAEFLDWKKGAINTIVLLVSSWTMAMSIYYAQKDQIKKSQRMLIFTLFCGFLFMLIKYIEYTHKFHDGIFPGGFFSYTGEGFVEGLPLYFSFYYLMTGLHASHVLIGMALIFWALFGTYKKRINSQHYMPLEYVGLFWHLVDLIWIYLFPLLYLVE
ncbi:MAG: cytochrome c oxidase subunit 3 family protein [Bdellovibrionaceae bacterium]|nr:cytochrome c oxidase subunit 3 family protein [Pseudobdellovibrionaceae bacterium]